MLFASITTEDSPITKLHTYHFSAILCNTKCVTTVAFLRVRLSRTSADRNRINAKLIHHCREALENAEHTAVPCKFSHSAKDCFKHLRTDCRRDGNNFGKAAMFFICFLVFLVLHKIKKILQS